MFDIEFFLVDAWHIHLILLEYYLTLRLNEFDVPNVTYQTLCIKYPKVNVTFELKYGFIHLLSTFHGFANEDPHKHLKKFHMVYYMMKPQDILEEHIKLGIFSIFFSWDCKGIR